jgi:hypothetical protein
MTCSVLVDLIACGPTGQIHMRDETSGIKVS